ncbi:MAG: hypothetical protein ACJAQW_001346 [Paracoccaceae bacterium]
MALVAEQGAALTQVDMATDATDWLRSVRQAFDDVELLEILLNGQGSVVLGFLCP